MPNLPEIWLGRHGETEWTIGRRHTGSTDVPLTDRGVEEAKRLGASFAGVEFGRVLSSPLSRALETARAAGLEPQIDERLVEWDYGEYEGRTTAQIKQERPDWDLWRDGCPGGESAADVAARLSPLLDELRERDGDRVTAARLYAEAARSAPSLPERNHLTRQAARPNAQLRH